MTVPSRVHLPQGLPIGTRVVFGVLGVLCLIMTAFIDVFLIPFQPRTGLVVGFLVAVNLCELALVSFSARDPHGGRWVRVRLWPEPVGRDTWIVAQQLRQLAAEPMTRVG